MLPVQPPRPPKLAARLFRRRASIRPERAAFRRRRRGCSSVEAATISRSRFRPLVVAFGHFGSRRGRCATSLASSTVVCYRSTPEAVALAAWLHCARRDDVEGERGSRSCQLASWRRGLTVHRSPQPAGVVRTPIPDNLAGQAQASSLLAEVGEDPVGEQEPIAISTQSAGPRLLAKRHFAGFFLRGCKTRSDTFSEEKRVVMLKR